MKEIYTQFIQQASQELADLLLRQLPAEQLEEVQYLDREANEILRSVGKQTMQAVFTKVAETVTQEAKAEGYTVERRPVIRVEVLFGAIEIESPYLRRKVGRGGCRPVAERVKLSHGTRTPAVERALSDFGSEESFGQAATRFAEHYGWEIGRSTVGRVVEEIAEQSEVYLTEKLEAVESEYEKDLIQRRGAKELLVELDGCQIRTVRCQSVRDECSGEIRRRIRELEWREVRVGLAGRLGSVKRTYVAALEGYKQVCRKLFQGAVIEGLSAKTKVIGVADGGQGLREELEAQFPGMQFILDKTHLRSHLSETAEALSLKGQEREEWVREKLEKISFGKVLEVLVELESKQSQCPRAGRLRGYLKRFQDAVHYEKYKWEGYPIGSGEVE